MPLPPKLSPAHPGVIILGGDVGGTKTWLGLFRVDGSDTASPLVLERSEKFASALAGSLDELVATFLAGSQGRVDFACFGLPGPVRGTRAKLINLPWEVDATEIAARFGFRATFLINDLVANARGIGELQTSDFEVLHNGAPHATGNMAVISPGTGLGEAGIFWDGQHHIPFACEGGHCDFAPLDDTQSALLAYLRADHDHVSVERVLSGSMGIPNIYRFLASTRYEQETPAVAAAIATKDPGATITRAAMDGSCPLCAQTMQLFVAILGAEAGNLALKTMATGGVYIGGGIAAKILPLLRTPTLREAFCAKGRFRHFMQQIPLRVILDDRAALLGAARHALLAAGTPAKGE